MKKIILLVFFPVLCHVAQAQSLSDGTISSFGTNTEAFVSTGGEAIVFPINNTTELAAGFIEILMAGAETLPVPPEVEEPEITDITENSATIRWQKIEGATSYKLNVYDESRTQLIASYALDENGKLRALPQDLLFNISDLQAATLYYIETIAYKEEKELCKQSAVLTTSTATHIDAAKQDSYIQVIENTVIITTTRQQTLSIYGISGNLIRTTDINTVYTQSLPSGIYILTLQNQTSRKVYKLNIK